MQDEHVVTIDVNAEIDRYFDDSSLASGEPPQIILLMGGPASGKTTIRRQKYAAGFVLVDAADIFINLSQGEFYPFPGHLEEAMEIVGNLVAHRAVSENRHIVTELIGADFGATSELIDAMRAAGYKINVEAITCDIEEAQRRNMARGDDNVSCFYAEPYQSRWLLDAARQFAATE